MKLLNSKNLKLRDKTFGWTSKVRNLLLKAKFVVSRELRLKTICDVFWYNRRNSKTI